jgi:hypothetical protein
MTAGNAEALLSSPGTDDVKAVPRNLWTLALYLTIMALGDGWDILVNQLGSGYFAGNIFCPT